MSENAERMSIASLLKRLDAKDATINRLTEQRDALLAALERRGQHDVSCERNVFRGTACTCGLDAAIAKARGK